MLAKIPSTLSPVRLRYVEVTDIGGTSVVKGWVVFSKVPSCVVSLSDIMKYYIIV